MAAGRNVVVIPVDNSQNAQEAFEFYATTLHKPDNHVLLIHAHNIVLPAPYNQLNTDVLQKHIQDEQEIVKDLMRIYKQKLEKYKISGKIVAENPKGAKPGPALVKFIEEQDARLVVMGSRGLGRVARTLLGSTMGGFENLGEAAPEVFKDTEEKSLTGQIHFHKSVYFVRYDLGIIVNC